MSVEYSFLNLLLDLFLLVNRNEYSVSRVRGNICEGLPTADIHTYLRFFEEKQGKFKIDICLYVGTSQ